MHASEIAAPVYRWQTASFRHPLTCGTDSRHRVLTPIIEGDTAVLCCLDCDYRQTFIPPVVLGGQDHAESPPTKD